MPPKPLARVTDPDALNASSGPRAQLSIAVPRSWFETGAELELLAPKRLACQRCDGGGCDSCDRAGVWRAPPAVDARTLKLQLPQRADIADHAGSPGVQLRLVSPFENCDIEQLLLTIRAAEQPSKGVRRVVSLVAASPMTSAGTATRALWVAAAVIAAAVAAGIAAW